MIIVHFFLRKTGGKMLLMADSSASEGVKPLWSEAEVICGADEKSDSAKWTDIAKAHILSIHPELEYLKTLRPNNRKNGATQVFDMTFNVKPKQGILHKIGIKK